MDLCGGEPDQGGVGVLLQHQQRIEVGAGQGFAATGAAADVPVPTRRVPARPATIRAAEVTAVRTTSVHPWASASAG